jgi:hypothetical protein
VGCEASSKKDDTPHTVALAVIKMKTLLSILTVVLFGHCSYGQTNDVWTSFWDNDSTHIGYKNADGKIMIEPTFEGFMVADKFDKVISVMTLADDKYETYYLNKSGKKFGVDSVHYFDNTPDRESEGYIRFKDKKTDLVGMFDKNGKVVVPAEYNALSRVQNGMIQALKNAEKKHWDSHKESGCNHFSWKGGQELLISPTNQIVIENFKYDGQVDFFSLEINEKPSSETNMVSFEGADNKYYHFTDLEQDFKLWLETTLLIDLDKQKLTEYTMDTITFWEDGWTALPNDEFIDLNFKTLHKLLISTSDQGSDNFVSIDGLNPFMYTSETYDQYFNTCGEAYRERYPVMNLVINHKINSDLVQDHFDFLKTDKGYRLINVTIRSENK